MMYQTGPGMMLVDLLLRLHKLHLRLRPHLRRLHLRLLRLRLLLRVHLHLYLAVDQLRLVLRRHLLRRMLRGCGTQAGTKLRRTGSATVQKHDASGADVKLGVPRERDHNPGNS